MNAIYSNNYSRLPQDEYLNSADKISYKVDTSVSLNSGNIMISRRKVKIVTVALAAFSALSLYYAFLRQPFMEYCAHLAYIKNSMICQKEPEDSSMPGCKNNVYCTA